MLRKIKSRIKQIGASQVASDLGYRTPNTIYTWLRNGKVPNSAKNKVKQYLNTGGK